MDYGHLEAEILDGLDEIKAEYLTKLKLVKLVEAGVDIDNAEQYVKFITADNEDEITLQAAEIVADINKTPNYVDPKVSKDSVWNPFN